MVLVAPSRKLTYHASVDDPASGEEVQNCSIGEPGNAVGSIAGAWRPTSTSVCSSFMVGSRHPPRASFSDRQCATASDQA